MDSTLFNILLSLVTLIITVSGGFLINFLREKIGSNELKKYIDLSKQIVMAMEQSKKELSGEDKKELAVKKLIELSGNKISEQQADLLIEASVYELKKSLIIK